MNLLVQAVDICVAGVVQGVGFRPFVYRLARDHGLKGWVLNDAQGVKIHIEGAPAAIYDFVAELQSQAPPGASIQSTKVEQTTAKGFETFEIRESTRGETVSTRISADLAVCEDCLFDLNQSGGQYQNYPYVNCTNCGPRFSIIQNLPYDRAATTMAPWKMCSRCQSSYDEPLDRRFHAQPVACSDCGPDYYLRVGSEKIAVHGEAIAAAVQLLRAGKILAIKGIGGYHLACDALDQQALDDLRARKFRKDKPFAVMVKDLETARNIAVLDAELESLLTSNARPITLAPAKIDCGSLAPDNANIGIMLPYTPLHQLLFNAGAPAVIVLTSANKSSEPIAYEDEEAFQQLDVIADAFLAGERPIARRVDDSVSASTAFGPVIYRRARGYAPGAVTTLPAQRPILAVGADLKNAVTLVVDGQAFVSQHIGDLEHASCHRALRETIDDLLRMYEVSLNYTFIVHDAHPTYFSTQYALGLPSYKTFAVQHHQAHIASVLAEHSAFDQQVLGIALDGTGYGLDSAIWGGEFFVGSLAQGFERVAHLLYAQLPGGDAAAKYPPQAAAGFLASVETPDMTLAPFFFSGRYLKAQKLVRNEIQSWPTSSTGRLFDTVAALCGFNREISFEAQAAIWLEHRARQSGAQPGYEFSFSGGCLDWRPALQQIIRDRQKQRPIEEIARAFHEGLASVLADAASVLCESSSLDKIVFSGGVMQNELLLELLHRRFAASKLTVWINHAVPANDGGISLGQAALACFRQ